MVLDVGHAWVGHCDKKHKSTYMAAGLDGPRSEFFTYLCGLIVWAYLEYRSEWDGVRVGGEWSCAWLTHSSFSVILPATRCLAVPYAVSWTWVSIWTHTVSYGNCWEDLTAVEIESTANTSPTFAAHLMGGSSHFLSISFYCHFMYTNVRDG